MIAIVTDSTCDIPADHPGRADIHVVPALVTIGQQTLRDELDISRDTFYNMLPTLPAIPTTSSPGPAAFLNTYERALRTADELVVVIMASQLSGLYNAARLAAEELAPERIHLVDSGQLSMGLGWAVLAGLEAARAGEPVEGVIHSIRDTLSRVRVVAVLNSIEFLARSGRVSLLALGISNLLSIKPIVELRNGQVKSIARVRTWSRALGTLADIVREFGPLERLAIMHSNRLDGVAGLQERLGDLTLPAEHIVTTAATTVIGVHVGPGAVGVAAVLSKSGSKQPAALSAG